MLYEWDRINQSQTLAKEIDIHSRLCLIFKDLSYVSLIYSMTYNTMKQNIS